MRMRNEQVIGGIVVKAGLRPAGEMENADGKKIRWNDEHQVCLIPFEEAVVKKYNIDSDCVHSVMAVLDAVHWGALVSLTLRGKRVVEATIETDALADFYEREAN